MKKLHVGIIAALIVLTLTLSLSLIVSAVGERKMAEKQNLEKSQNEVQLYKTKVLALEKELETLKEEQYLSNRQYEDKIAELELKLVVNNKVEEDKPIVSDAQYTYTVSDSGITITSYSGSDIKLVVPQTIDGIGVINIGREAFKDASFKEVVLPDGLKKIDWFSFSECGALEKITIPNSVNKIEYGAFDGTEGFTISCQKNSYAHRYAKSYGFNVKND